MTTKDKILNVSRELFNNNGLSSTTVRTISNEIGISVGNFSYHFPNKDKIVEELYQNMLNEIQLKISEIAIDDISILNYLESHKLIFEIQTKYKFIYLNLFEVLTKHPNIKMIYLSNVELEKKTASNLLQLYAKKGIIKKNINQETFDKVINVGHILHNTWLIEAEILYKGNEIKKLKNYLKICCGLLEPFLTTKSLKEYYDYFSKL